MKKLLPLLLFLFILSCKNDTSKRTIPIFNAISFQTNKGEKLSLKNQIVTETYKSYFSNEDIQIPLFKYIKGKNYSIYISIPYNTTLKNLEKQQFINPKFNQKNFQTDSTSYFFRKFADKSTYISIYSKEFDKNLIFVLTETNSKKISDSLFNKTKLSKRFIKD